MNEEKTHNHTCCKCGNPVHISDKSKLCYDCLSEIYENDIFPNKLKFKKAFIILEKIIVSLILSLFVFLIYYHKYSLFPLWSRIILFFLFSYFDYKMMYKLVYKWNK